MNTRKIRRMAAEVLGVGAGRVRMAETGPDAFANAMTKDDVRALAKDRSVFVSKSPMQSRGRARLNKGQRKKGRQRGFGTRKGPKSARDPGKDRWMKNVRALRSELAKLRREHPKEVDAIGYRKLYNMIKGNFFRGRKYLSQFVLSTGASK